MVISHPCPTPCLFPSLPSVRWILWALKANGFELRDLAQRLGKQEAPPTR